MQESLNNSAALKAKLRFRAWHRGTREADLLLGRFADAHLDGLSDEELQDFAALLDCAEPDIWDWLIGKAVPPAPHNGPLWQKIQQWCLVHNPAAEGRGG